MCFQSLYRLHLCVCNTPTALIYWITSTPGGRGIKGNSSHGCRRGKWNSNCFGAGKKTAVFWLGSLLHMLFSSDQRKLSHTASVRPLWCFVPSRRYFWINPHGQLLCLFKGPILCKNSPYQCFLFFFLTTMCVSSLSVCSPEMRKVHPSLFKMTQWNFFFKLFKRSGVRWHRKSRLTCTLSTPQCHTQKKKNKQTHKLNLSKLILFTSSLFGGLLRTICKVTLTPPA